VGLIDSILTGLRSTSAPEAVSVVFGLLYSILAVRRTRWCWVAGGISSGILIVLAWQAKLPMQACLQAYYVGMAVYGFWHWSQEEGSAKAVTTWPLKAHLIAGIAILVVSALWSRYLATGTEAAWPFLDSLTTFGSLLATWLTAQVKLENWLYWIVFDAISVFLFVAQGLMFVALLMVIYLVIASFGYVSWARSRRAPAPREAA
jgi:nicotinamide mononucleotide transporter